MAKSFTDRNSTANIGWSKKLHLLVIVIALETQMLKYQPKVSYNFRWGMTHGLTELTATIRGNLSSSFIDFGNQSLNFSRVSRSSFLQLVDVHRVIWDVCRPYFARNSRQTRYATNLPSTLLQKDIRERYRCSKLSRAQLMLEREGGCRSQSPFHSVLRCANLYSPNNTINYAFVISCYYSSTKLQHRNDDCLLVTFKTDYILRQFAVRRHAGGRQTRLEALMTRS